jgi:hypothetical protein
LPATAPVYVPAKFPRGERCAEDEYAGTFVADLLPEGRMR